MSKRSESGERPSRIVFDVNLISNCLVFFLLLSSFWRISYILGQHLNESPL